MNPILPLQQRFEQAALGYHATLKHSLDQAVSEASDKDYAYTYYRRTLLERHPDIPYNSAFFQVLSATFLHNLRVCPSDAVENTLNTLPQIREICNDALEAALGGKPPELYAELMESEGCSPEEI